MPSTTCHLQPPKRRRSAQLPRSGVRSLARDARGATFVEYLVILGILALGLIGALRLVGNAVDEKANAQATAIVNLTPPGGVVSISRSPTDPNATCSGFWDCAWEKGKSQLRDIGTGLSNAATGVGSKAKSLWDDVKGVPGWVQGELREGAQQVQRFQTWVKRGVDWLETEETKATRWLQKQVDGIPVLQQGVAVFSWLEDQSTQLTGGVLKGAVDMVGGIVQAVVDLPDTLMGLEGLAEHLPVLGIWNPLQIVHGLYNAATTDATLSDELNRTLNPTEIAKEDSSFWKGMVKGFVAPYKESWDQGKYAEVIGRGVFDLGSFLIGGGEASASAKAAAAADKAADAANIASKSADGANAASKAADAAKAADGAKAADKAGDAANGTDKTGDTTRTAQNAETPAGCQGESCKSPTQCFAAGTLVHTEHGLRPIEHVAAGDRVWARDAGTGEVGLQPVVQRFVTAGRSVLSLLFSIADGSTESLTVTAQHPFWTGTTWTAATDLHKGDKVTLISGARAVVQGSLPLSQRITVYNFEVSAYHTYFVGTAGMWVHNQCDPAGHASGKTQDEFVNAYKQANPHTKFTDEELRELYDDGNYVINEQTGRLNDLRAGKYGPPQVTADYVLDANGKVQVERLSREQVVKLDPSAEQSAKDLAIERQKLLDRARQSSDEAAKTEDYYKAILKSEKLGENAGEVFAKNEGYTNISKGSGARTFDQVYTDKSGNVVILETKGGASPLGDRFAATGTTRVQQGTEAYVRAVAQDLQKTDEVLANKVLTALAQKKLKYYEVRQPLTDQGKLEPIEAKEFKL